MRLPRPIRRLRYRWHHFKRKVLKKHAKAFIAGGALVIAAIIAFGIFLLCRPKAPVTEPVPEKDWDYVCDIGFEGLRVKRAIQALGMGDALGMGGAYYSQQVKNKVTQFQEEHGLPATGQLDLDTWKAMGYTEEEWVLCGNYRSPDQTTAETTREGKIELMIERAYDYLGDPYVIGASGPPGQEYGLDCSGLVMQALYAAGVSMDDINVVSHAQPGHEYESRNIWNSDHFTNVGFDDRERGDLIFYSDAYGVVNHIAIYLGDNEVIESWPNEVQVSPVADGRHYVIIGVKRVFPEEKENP